MPQTVFHSARSCWSIATLVPPTEVTHGSEEGKSACGRLEVSAAPHEVAGSSAPQSPEEKLNPMP